MTDEKNDEYEAGGEERGHADERFLINEGLDLLSAFRAIQDDGVRKALLTIVVALASNSNLI